MRRTSVLAATAACSLLLAMGCSKTDTTSTGGPAATSAPAASSTTTTIATVAKDKVIEDGDKICKAAHDKSVASQPTSSNPSASELETYFKDGLAGQRDAIKQIKALGTPDKDADKLTTALDKATAYLDAIEKKIPDYAKDPSLIKADTEMNALENEANTAAKDFGFKECGKSSSSSGDDTSTTTPKKTTTTSSGSTGGDSTTTAKTYLSGLSKTITFTDDQVACVAKNVFDDPALSKIALSSTTTVDERKQLFGALVDCVGPQFLIDAFMTGVDKKNPTAEQSACIRKDLEALSKTEGIALVSGDADAVSAFTAKIAADCKL